MKYLVTFFLLCSLVNVQAQVVFYSWNFDVADTTTSKILFDTTHLNNIWQIGKPQKTAFDSAYSPLNVLVTDTINTYPINDTSIFTIVFPGYILTPSWWALSRAYFYYRLDIDS